MPKALKIAVAILIFASSARAQESQQVRPRMPGDTGVVSTEHQKDERIVAIAELEACDVLVVFAHPDDETFALGTLARLSAKGERVQLAYATSGDAGGDLTNRGLSGPALGAEREQEMRNAAIALELATEPLFLRYPDGQVYDHWNEVLESVRAIIAKTNPKVVITFGPDGYYGHADHVAISQIAARAFDDSGTPSHLLHVAISRSTNDLIVRLGGGSSYKPVADKYVTYTVKVRDQLEKRVGAISSHKTQFDEKTVAQFRMLATITGTEQFVEVRHSGETGALSELFAGAEPVASEDAESAPPAE